MLTRRAFLGGAASLLPAGALAHRGRTTPSPPPLPRGVPGGVPEEAYWRELRRQFLLPDDAAYCNTATLGAMPRSALHALEDHLRLVEESLVDCDWSPDKPKPLAGYRPERGLRDRIGRFLGCDGDEVALVGNATKGLSYVAAGLDLEEGDEVLLTDQEHPGGRSAWDVKARRSGIVVREVPIPVPPRHPEEILERFRGAFTRRTRVLAVPHVTSALGIVLPVKQLAAMARERGCATVVDGAQGAGHVPVDVREIGCDAYACSPHKWLLAPKGTGWLYLRGAFAPRVWSTVASSQWDNRDDHGWRLSQTGTGNLSLLRGTEAALDVLDGIGHERIRRRIRELGDRLREGLGALPHVRIHSAVHPALCAGIVTWSVDRVPPEETAALLWEKARVRVRTVAGPAVRQSLHVYCAMEEVGRTVEAVASMAGR